AVLFVACGSDPGSGEMPADGAAHDASHDSTSEAHDAGPSDASTPDASPDAGDAETWIDGCPPGMAGIENFFVDRWEAYVVELDDAGNEVTHSPYYVIYDGVVTRAKSAGGVVPQGYISQIQASDACANAGKRLCDASEFALACRGPDPANDYPYGGSVH